MSVALLAQPVFKGVEAMVFLLSLPSLLRLWFILAHGLMRLFLLLFHGFLLPTSFFMLLLLPFALTAASLRATAAIADCFLLIISVFFLLISSSLLPSSFALLRELLLVIALILSF